MGCGTVHGVVDFLAFVFCASVWVDVCVIGAMEFWSDNDDFVLSQQPVRAVDNSSSNENGVVSLEGGADSNFELWMDGLIEPSQVAVSDNVVIEDINSDEELEKM